MKVFDQLLLAYTCLLLAENIQAQRSILDVRFSELYRPLRLLGLNFIGRTSENKENIRHVHRNGKAQPIMEKEFFCDTKNGPGKRSDTPPTSIHRLRPGDIDIIGALGDSLTAGNAIMATNMLEATIENRGLACTIGGQGNWERYLTLPNILKEFNPNLYGYSLKDGLSTDRSSKFNVAELGAMSRDLLHEAKILTKRLKADKLVNVTHHWKLVTVLIGNNDFCSDMCYYPNPEKTLEWHEQNMLKTLRFLRDNIPRLMVNIIPAPNLGFIPKMTGIPMECEPMLRFSCPCLAGKDKSTVAFYENLMLKWVEVDKKVAYREEFNSETFTVNVQPFTQFKRRFPKRLKDGSSDMSDLSVDCFHLSQKGHACCATGLWNNMLETEGQKYEEWMSPFEKFKCPTVERPYIATRINSYNANL